MQQIMWFTNNHDAKTKINYKNVIVPLIRIKNKINVPTRLKRVIAQQKNKNKKPRHNSGTRRRAEVSGR